MKTVYYKTRQ